MAKGNEIVVSANPENKFLEGIVSGTPKPGTLMQIKAATEPIGGRYTWEVYTPGSDGDRALVAILLPADLSGNDETVALSNGDRCKLYCPAMSEEMNVLVANIAGTSDAFAIGDKLIGDSGTGMLIATTGDPESEPFVVLETLAAITADTLVHVMYTGV